jgi:hypothetical protein
MVRATHLLLLLFFIVVHVHDLQRIKLPLYLGKPPTASRLRPAQVDLILGLSRRRTELNLRIKLHIMHAKTLRCIPRSSNL